MASRWSLPFPEQSRDKKKDLGREDAKRGGRGEGREVKGRVAARMRDDKFARIGTGWWRAEETLRDERFLLTDRIKRNVVAFNPKNRPSLPSFLSYCRHPLSLVSSIFLSFLFFIHFFLSRRNNIEWTKAFILICE